MQSEEATLWAAARAGDSRAFSEMFDLHYDRVFRHVIGLTDQRADADEITGSAFLDLWRLRDRVRLVGGGVLPWLLITASNHARNNGRRAGRYRALLRRLPREDEWADVESLVADRDERDRRAAALAAALRRLKPIDAQLVALTLHDEVSIQDAAEIIGLSSGAARVRLHRARAQLRNRLGPDVSHTTSEEAAR